MSKKILVVCQHYWPENFRLNDIVDGFIERGCQVDVLCGQPNYPTGQFVEGYSTFKPKFEKHGEVNVYRTMEIKRGSNSNLRIFLNYMCYPIASWFRVASLKNNKYDSIFIYELSPVMMAFAGYRLSRLTGIPVTMYVLDLWPHNLYSVLDIQSPTLKKILAAVSARQYRKAHHLITVSDRARQYFERELDIPAHRITCIPQCPEKLYETPIVDHTLLDKYAGSFNIVFTGNVSPAQSFETVI
ncbi:MAG: glycosyltransferase, partial [Parasporobacterium sp.]|nr:glycosyltransferase [Parasporobacterium sp.]